MTFEVSSNPLDKISADAVLVFAFEGKDEFSPTQSLYEIDNVVNGLLLEALKLEDFKAKEGELFNFSTHKKILSPRVFVLGFGKKEEFDQNKVRKVMAVFAKSAKKKIASLALTLLSLEFKVETTLQSQVMAEGLLLGNYGFNKYKKEDDGKKELVNVIFSESNKNVQLKIKEGIRWAEIFSNATRLARDLVNEPASLVTPTFLAQMAQDLAKKNPQIKCTVYDKAQAEKMGMNAFLGVAQAADTPPKFIHLEYVPKGYHGKPKLAIVGKGITFDSGGVSIKSWESMKTMKLDMAGAAAVLGVFSAISELSPKIAVMGLIAATPNLISAKAVVPGDVLKALNGKTIEVLSTDAEGRVTLADSLSFAVKKGASEIVDLATLTGACEVALGTDIAGLFSNNESLKEKIQKAASNAGERIWELPLVKEYKELNKSEVADIANIPSTRYGGAITAALFLEEFVDGKPWVHLDIAGPAFVEKEQELGPKGGTGFGVRLLLNFLKNL